MRVRGVEVAVGAEVRADGTHRSRQVQDERALTGIVHAAVEGVLGPSAADARRVEVRAIQDAGAGAGTRRDRQAVVEPAVAELLAVRGGDDGRVLGVESERVVGGERRVAHLVGRRVVTAVEAERVVHAGGPGAAAGERGAVEQVHVAELRGDERVRGLHHLTRAHVDTRRGRDRPARLLAGVVGEHRELVVRVERGIGVARRVRGRHRVAGRGPRGRRVDEHLVGRRRAEDGRPDAGRPVVDPARVHEVALVHLHGDLVPVLAVPREADDVHRVAAEQLRQRRAREHDRVRRAGQRRAEAGAAGEAEERGDHERDRERGPARSEAHDGPPRSVSGAAA